MDLEQMIEKYEGVKKKLEKLQCAVSPTTENLCSIIGDVEVVNTILDDLKSVRDQQPSWVTLRDKVLKKIDEALDGNDPCRAETLARVLKMLPD